MMKKMISLALAVLMLVGMVACGGSKGGDASGMDASHPISG